MCSGEKRRQLPWKSYGSWKQQFSFKQLVVLKSYLLGVPIGVCGLCGKRELEVQNLSVNLSIEEPLRVLTCVFAGF